MKRNFLIEATTQVRLSQHLLTVTFFQKHDKLNLFGCGEYSGVASCFWLC